MTVTKTNQRAAQSAGRMDHSIYPPIERFQTIDGVIRNHAREGGQSPLVCYPVRGASDFEEHTAVEVDRHTDIAAHFYINKGLGPAVSD